ncbi:MAG: hypothetical protein KGI04_00830 [Candidatus Micrarchaeota archaeon]|nr:hypothetical protein [Candidatus Micrarchaeota archaeon]
MAINKLQVLLYTITLASIVSVVLGDSLLSSLSATLCGFVTTIRTIIGVLALALFLIGGVLYAIAHFLPTSLDYRKNLMGWSTAMIVGGIIGLVVVIIAQPLVTLFIQTGSAAGGSVSSIFCP